MVKLNDADKVMIGSTQADKVYMGSTVVWQPSTGEWTPNDLTNLIAWYDFSDPTTMLLNDGVTNPSDGDGVQYFNNKATGATAGTHQLTNNADVNVLYKADNGGYIHLKNKNNISFEDLSPQAGDYHGNTEMEYVMNSTIPNTTNFASSGVTLALMGEPTTTHVGEYTNSSRNTRGNYSGVISAVDYYRDNVLKQSNTGTDPADTTKQTLRDEPAGWWTNDYFTSGGNNLPTTKSAHIRSGITDLQPDTYWRFFNQTTPSSVYLHCFGNFKDLIVVGAMSTGERASLQTWTEGRRAPAWIEIPDAAFALWEANGEDTHAVPPIDPADPISRATSVYFGSQGPDTMVADLIEVPEYPYIMKVAIVEVNADPPEPETDDFKTLWWDGAKYTGNFPGIQEQLETLRDQVTEIFYYFKYQPDPESEMLFEELTERLRYESDLPEADE